ncbi:hypothetical protein [Streptomyces sp. NPDC094468]|uniref:hypothetical protein n=1 Tax=Streptomyces sp. NPDC094468 TaxID=3366066 RepID=UPI003829BAFE
MVVDELEESLHQFGSPAKYLAALRSVSRSVASLHSLASSFAAIATSCRIRSPDASDPSGVPVGRPASQAWR